jgi:hypothetical protein
MLAFLTPNPEQTKSIIRWLISAFGAGLAGWFAHSGYVSQQQVLDVLNSPAFLSAAVSVVGAIVGLIAHTQSNAVAVVAKIAADPNSPVVGILTTANPEGRALAASIPRAEIAPVGSVGANNIASDSVPPMTEKTSPGPTYQGGPKA